MVSYVCEHNWNLFSTHPLSVSSLHVFYLLQMSRTGEVALKSPNKKTKSTCFQSNERVTHT